MKRVNIRVSDQMHEWYMGKSEKRGITASALMNEALNEFMQRSNQPNENFVSKSNYSFTEWHKGYEVIKSDRFQIGSFEVYCSRRNSGMSEEMAYKILQRHVEYQYLSIMEWLFWDKSKLEELLADINESSNRQNQKLIDMLLLAKDSEKLAISQELFKYYKASKYEPSAIFELMYQETSTK